MLDNGHSGDVLDGNPYGDWIRNYEVDAYLESVQYAINAFDDVGKRRGGEARLEHLSKIFTTATKLESAFWQMGMNAAATPLRAAAE